MFNIIKNLIDCPDTERVSVVAKKQHNLWLTESSIYNNDVKYIYECQSETLFDSVCQSLYNLNRNIKKHHTQDECNPNLYDFLYNSRIKWLSDTLPESDIKRYPLLTVVACNSQIASFFTVNTDKGWKIYMQSGVISHNDELDDITGLLPPDGCEWEFPANKNQYIFSVLYCDVQ